MEQRRRAPMNVIRNVPDARGKTPSAYRQSSASFGLRKESDYRYLTKKKDIVSKRATTRYRRSSESRQVPMRAAARKIICSLTCLIL